MVEEHRDKRGDSVRAKSAEQRCFMNLRFFMHDEEQTWHLSHKSNLKHSYHMPEEENSKLLNKNDLNDDQLATLNILYGSDVPSSVPVHHWKERAICYRYNKQYMKTGKGGNECSGGK